MSSDETTRLEVYEPHNVFLYAISGFGKTPKTIAQYHLQTRELFLNGSSSDVDVGDKLDGVDAKPNTVITFKNGDLEGAYYYLVYRADSKQLALYVFEIVQVSPEEFVSMVLAVPRLVDRTTAKDALSALDTVFKSIIFTPQPSQNSPTQSYSTTIGNHYKGTLSFQYPSSWYVIKAGNILLQNTEDNPASAELRSGQIRVIMTQPEYNMKLFTTYEQIAGCRVDTSKINALSLLEIQLPKTPEEKEALTAREISYTLPEQIDVNGLSVAFSHITRPGVESLYIAIDMGDGLVFTLGAESPGGAMYRYQAQLFDIVRSFSFKYEGCS